MKLGTQQEGIADRIRVDSLIELGQDQQGVGLCRGSPPVAVDENLPKPDLGITAVGLGLLVQKILQLLIRRLDLGRDVFEEVLHFQAHSLPNQAVIAVQAGRQGFAIVNFVADEGFDQMLRLSVSRRSLPGLLEQPGHLPDVVLGDGDLQGRGVGQPNRRCRRAASHVEEHKQRRADKQKMQQRLFQE